MISVCEYIHMALREGGYAVFWENMIPRVEEDAGFEMAIFLVCMILMLILIYEYTHRWETTRSYFNILIEIPP